MTVDHQRMAVLHERKMSAKQIAAELGCTKRTVTRWRRTSGLTRPLAEHVGYAVTEERLAAAETMLNDGSSFNDIAKTLHMGRETLNKYFPGRALSRAESAQRGVLGQRLSRIASRLP